MLLKVGFECEECGRGKGDVILQVHHIYYNHDLKPWEYNEDACKVLCRGCHARTHGLAMPLNGWTCLHSDWDVGEKSDVTQCDLCETTMEWHNYLFHPKWGTINVGYDCADKLIDGHKHEKERMNRARSTFIKSPRWEPSGGDGTRYYFDYKDVGIYPRGRNKFIAKVNGQPGKLLFDTIDQAKKKAFKYLWDNDLW